MTTKELANGNSGPRADDLRNFKPFQAWLRENRMTYAEWERRQPRPSQRTDTQTGVLRAKLDLADAQAGRR
ncbi:MAG: hypothetical protein AB1591_02555 [Pseudomonadota bacterium]